MRGYTLLLAALEALAPGCAATIPSGATSPAG